MRLIEKDSGCRAMLRDNKTDDLARLFTLYNQCGPRTIDPIAAIFKKHIEEEGLSLVHQVSDVVAGGTASSSASNRKEVQAAEQQFVRKVIDLQVRAIAACELSRRVGRSYSHSLHCLNAATRAL
jgi:cullin 1